MKKLFIFFLTLCPYVGYMQPPVGSEFTDSNPFNVIDREISVDYSSLNNLFDAFRNNQNIEVNQIFSLFQNRFEGSPFLLQEWKNSSVILKNGEKINYDLLYNVFKNEFWIKKEEGIKLLLFTEDVDHVEFDNKKFVRKTYPFEKDIKEGLLQIITNDKYPLFKLYTCIFLRKEAESTGYESKKKDKFQIREQLYYQDKEGYLYPISTKKDDFFKIFRDKSSIVGAYCKINKLKYRKEEDIIKLFHYYSTL